jgi:hypothetical protein
MDIKDFRIRVNGRNVDSQRICSIRFQTVASLTGDIIRSHFFGLKARNSLDSLQRRFVGFPIRAGFSVAAEDPLLLNTDSVSDGCSTSADINIGCAMKLVVSSVLHDHLAIGHCSLQDTVIDVLGLSSIQGTSGAELSITDLLNHRHGLEDDRIPPKAFLRDGRIDLPSLIQALEKLPARTKPSMYYSYSRVGYWLIGALLQRLEMKSFSEIVASHGFRVTGDVCPAMGGGCQISAAELLSFLVRRLHRAKNHRTCAPVPPHPSNEIALPGWHINEKGIQYGWKTFSRGWLGHNAFSPSEVGVIRVHPETGTAMFIWAPHSVFPQAAQHWFGRIFVERSNIPKRLQLKDWVLMKPSRFVGTYRSGSRSFRVNRADANGLSATLENGAGPGRHLHLSYAPSERDSFFADAVKGKTFAFIQFISSSSGAIDALWNGHRIWPRVDTD